MLTPKERKREYLLDKGWVYVRTQRGTEYWQAAHFPRSLTEKGYSTTSAYHIQKLIDKGATFEPVEGKCQS